MEENQIPLYAKIIEDMRNKILCGEWTQGDRLPSEIEVARRFGVSRITSKRAFDELEREGLIYRVRGSGSYVMSKSQKTGISACSQAGIKIIHILLPFYSAFGRGVDIIRGANDFLEPRGYFLKIHNSMRDPAKEKEALLNLYQSGAEGVIFYPLSNKENMDIVQMLSIQNFPIILIDKYCDGLSADSVVSDNFRGMYDAMAYLLERGHCDIAFISDVDVQSISSVKDRFLGYCEALKDYGKEIRYENYLLNYGDYIRKNYPSIYQMMIENTPLDMMGLNVFKNFLSGMLERPNSVTAMVAVNDYVAMYFMKAALGLGMSLPAELSIIGFDNLEFSPHLEIPLTTVEQDFYNMGYTAAEFLIQRISGERDSFGKTMLPVKLIERNSVKLWRN